MTPEAQAKGNLSIESRTRRVITFGGKTLEQLKLELGRPSFQLRVGARSFIDNRGFNNPAEPKRIELIYPRVRDLGLSGYPTLAQITNRGRELGWHKCPVGVGPYLRLQYTEQPLGSIIWVVMEPMTDTGGNPGVFELGHGKDGLWLGGAWVDPDDEWGPDDGLVFSLGK